MVHTFYNLDDSENSIFILLHGCYKRNNPIFFIIIFSIAILLIALPLAYIDITVRAQGIIRPANERTEIKSVISGIIDSVFYKEGSLVHEGAVILRFKDNITQTKALHIQHEMDLHMQFIHDLKLLTAGRDIDASLVRQLISTIYKQQSIRFIYRRSEQEALLRKAHQEEKINSYLAREKVISPKEFFDIQIQHDRANASYKAFEQEQLNEWQQDLVKYESGLAQHEIQQKQLAIDIGWHEVKSPLTGFIQNIQTHYPGNSVQANETICMLSPEGDMIGECYVSTGDIGLIKKNQQAYFQVDAFDYNYFGVLTGQIIAIDNDYTMIDGRPVFKIRCSFNNKTLHIEKGPSMQLKKGLTFHARFIIGQRTLWQLLFDKMDDWLNPSAPK